MRLVLGNRRLWLLAVALAALAAIAAWRVSAPAQAHRARPRASRVVRHSRHGSTRPESAAVNGSACFTSKSGIEGYVRVVQRCGGTPCTELVLGGFREAMPSDSVPAPTVCGSKVLPPGYAVPIGRAG